MTITQTYAAKLIKAGKATLTTTVTDDRGHVYQVLDRHDLQRVDHYRVS